MTPDFDYPVSRAGTHAEKYTARQRLFGRQDVLPFWVADMEFAAAPAIRKALAERAAHPVYGYTSVPGKLIAAIIDWNSSSYNVQQGEEAVTLVPGVMAGISAAIAAFSEPGDAIIVQPPLYPPLMHTVTANGRVMLANYLVLENGRYRMNFAELEYLCRTRKPKMLLFCSPHNPVGRVWEKEELAGLADLVMRHRLYLVSDEIHADIIFPPHCHCSALSVDKEAARRIIVLNSASKSFNVAGLQTAYALIPDESLRDRFRSRLRGMNLHGVNLFGMAALEAAYSRSEEWLAALLSYLQANREYMTQRLNSGLPGLCHYVPEGTYLYWLDFNSLGLPSAVIREKLIDEAKVGLNDGLSFSTANKGFWRFNFAVPRSMLEEGLNRIIRVFS